jgi:exopolysaccharide biosynthesis protein
VENGRVLVYCAGEKGNISEAIASINQRTLRRVAQNMVKRVNACIRENGGHFQQFTNCVSGFVVL